jgi:hypothetical protein
VKRENNISVDFFNNLKRLKNAATNFCIIDRYLVRRMWEGTKKEKKKVKKRKESEYRKSKQTTDKQTTHPLT